MQISKYFFVILSYKIFFKLFLRGLLNITTVDYILNVSLN